MMEDGLVKRVKKLSGETTAVGAKREILRKS
jgi:hypothetical protein